MADEALELHLYIDPRFPDLSGDGSHGLLYGEHGVHGQGASLDLLPGGTFQRDEGVGEIDSCHVPRS